MFRRKKTEPYRSCGKKYGKKKLPNGSELTLICTRRKGHAGGHSNRRTN